METITVERLRERLTQTGITRRQLARAADIEYTNISAILRGKQYLGKARRGRIEAALASLERRDS